MPLPFTPGDSQIPILEGRDGDTIHAVCIGGPLNRQIRKGRWGNLWLDIVIEGDPPGATGDGLDTFSYIARSAKVRYRLVWFEWRSPAWSERPNLARKRLFWVYHALSNDEAQKLMAAELGLATTLR